MKPASKHPAVIGDRLSSRLSKPHGPNKPAKPGGRGGYDVDDEVFFTCQSGGPSSGRVISHGQHGCTVDDAVGGRHQVTWDRVLGLKGRKTFPARVVGRRHQTKKESDSSSRFPAAVPCYGTGRLAMPCLPRQTQPHHA